MTRQFCRLMMVGVALWAGLAGCMGDTSSNGPTGSSLTVQAQLPSGSAAQTLGLAPGTAADVATVTVDVKQGTTELISAQGLTQDGGTGMWSGAIANLPLGVTLTFIGHAYDNGGEPTELFTGQVDQVLSGIDDQVSIPLAVVDTGVSAVLPRIDKLISPNAVGVSPATGTVIFTVSGSSGEILSYLLTPAASGGTFGEDTGSGVTGSGGQGTLALEGTQGTVTVTYTAPAAEGTYVHTLKVTNSQGNFVERQFQVQVCSAGCGNLVAVNTAPVITALGGQRFDAQSGTNIQWTATVSDDGPVNELTYQWSFDGGLSFTNPTVNPAVLPNYTTSTYGLIRITVKDHSGGAGSLSTTLSYFMPTGQFPATGDQASAGTNGDWKEVASGNCHTVAIRNDGTLWAWGCNDKDQLGMGYASSTNVLVPTQVGTATNWAHVRALDEDATVAMRTDGTVWTWGDAYYGQLGLGDAANRSRPSQINMFSNNYSGNGASDLATAIAAGAKHVLVLRGDGTLWAFGDNTYGRLGDGTTSAHASPVRVCRVYESGACTSPLTGVTAMAAGADGSLAVVGGALYAWGRNNSGQVGLPADVSNHPLPVQVGTATNWVRVAMAADTAYSINDTGTLYAWGYNGNGEQGTGDTVSRAAPAIAGLPSDVWLAIAARNDHVLAIKSPNGSTSDTAGTLWAWGNNNYGDLGLGDTATRATPSQVGVDVTWRSVAVGADSSFGIQTASSLWAWGYNSDGQLGLGSATDAHTPMEVRQ